MTKGIARRGVRRHVSAARREIFLAELARTGVVAHAARVASSEGMSRKGPSSSFYQARRDDPAFAVRWQNALEESDSKLLIEARRRAIEGTDRGIFQQGKRVFDHDGKPATHKEYSDRILELILKARFPNEYIERRSLEFTPTISGWTISGDDLACLTPKQTEDLKNIMRTIMVSRNEIVADPPLELEERKI